MQKAWNEYTEEHLREMWDRSIPALNQANNLYAPLLGAGGWKAIDLGRCAMEELNRRANCKADGGAGE